LSYRPLFLGRLAAAGLRRFAPHVLKHTSGLCSLPATTIRPQKSRLPDEARSAFSCILFGLFVRVMRFAVTAVLFELETLGVVLLVLLRVVVASLALCACHHDYHAVFFFRHRYRPWTAGDIKENGPTPVNAGIIPQDRAPVYEKALYVKTAGVAKLLRIFVGERDRAPGQPLYTAVVEKIRHAGLAGATVFKGIEGFGKHATVHSARVIDLASDLPILIEVVDTEERIRAFLPTLDTIIEEGLVTLESVELIRYRRAESAASPEGSR
jgi:PII-like signaling protein